MTNQMNITNLGLLNINRKIIDSRKYKSESIQITGNVEVVNNIASSFDNESYMSQNNLEIPSELVSINISGVYIPADTTQVAWKLIGNSDPLTLQFTNSQISLLLGSAQTLRISGLSITDSTEFKIIISVEESLIKGTFYIGDKLFEKSYTLDLPLNISSYKNIVIGNNPENLEQFWRGNFNISDFSISTNKELIYTPSTNYPLKFSKIMISDGEFSLTNSSVGILDHVYEFEIKEISRSGNTILLTCVLDGEAKLTIREIGLYATTNEGEILFSKLDGLSIDKGSGTPYDLIFTVNLNLSFLNLVGLPEIVINEPEYTSLEDYTTVKEVNLYVLTNLERLINMNAINIGYNKAQVLYRWQQEIERGEDCYSSIQTYTKLVKNLKRIIEEEFDPSLLERHGYNPESGTGGNALTEDGVAYGFTSEDYLSEIVSFDNADSWDFKVAFEASKGDSGTIATLNSPSSYQPLVVSAIGSEWDPITYQSTLGSNSWRGITYGNNKFVAISYGGRISTSTDGKTWLQSSAVTNLGNNGWQAIAYGNSKFVAIGWSLNPYTYISTSSTGTTWTAATANETIGYNNWRDIAFGNNKFVIIQENGLLSTSEDGTTWTAPIQSSTLGSHTWRSIAFGSDKFVAIGSTGYVSTSYDGIYWTSPVQTTALGSHNWHNITFGNNKFMALGENGYVSTSTDGINWTEASQDLYTSIVDSGSWTGLSYANNTFVAIRTSGYTSTYNSSPICHLKAGQEETLIATIPYKDIAEGTISSSDISYTRNLNLNFTKFNKFYENPDNAVFISNEHIASGFGGAELKVSPFNNYEYWISNGQPKGLPDVTSLKGLSYGNDVYAVVCNKKLFYSTDFLNWTECPSNSTFTNDSTFSDIIFNDGIFIALKNNGDLYQSTNGRNWNLLSIQSSSQLWTGIAYNDENNYYAAITSKGRIFTKQNLSEHWQSLLPSINISTPTTQWVGIAYGSSNGQSYKYFMALRSDGFIAYLPSLSGWTSIGYINSAITSEWTSITYCSNQFFATAIAGYVGVSDSDDFTSWTTLDVANHRFLRYLRHFLLSLTYVGTKLIGLSPDNIIIIDIDESEVSSAKSFKFYNYIPANYSPSTRVFITENTESSTFLALDSSGHYYFSEDGMNWTPPLGQLTSNKTWIGITYGTTVTPWFEFIAVSQDGCVCTSVDGIEWPSPVQRISLLSGETISFTAREENGIIVLTKFGRIFLSGDGISWNESASGSSALSNSYYLGYLNSKFYAINSTGTIYVAEHFNSSWEQLSSIPFLMTDMSLAYSNGKLMALGTGTDSIATISTNDGATWGTPFDVPITTGSSGSILLNIQNNFVIIDPEKYMYVAPSMASLIASTFNETISFKTPANFSDDIVVQTSEEDNGLKILLTSSNPTTGEVDFLLPILSNTPIALYNGLEINTNYDLNINISKISNSTYSFNTTISKVGAGSTEIIGTISSEIATSGIGIGNILLGGNNSNYSLNLNKFSITMNNQVVVDPETILQGWSTVIDPELYKLHVEATPSITNTPVLNVDDSSTELTWEHGDILTDSWNISINVHTGSTDTKQYLIGNSTNKTDSPINLKIEDDGKLSFYPAINNFYAWNGLDGSQSIVVFTISENPTPNEAIYSRTGGNSSFIPNGFITSISPVISCTTSNNITLTDIQRVSSYDVELPEVALITQNSLKANKEYTIEISYNGSKYSLEYELTPASETEYPDSENLSLYSQVKIPFKPSNSFTFGSNRGSDEFLGTIDFLNTSFSANDYEWRGASQLSSVFTVPINPSTTEELYDSSAYSLGTVSCDFNGGYFIDTDLFIMNPDTKYYLDINRNYQKYIVFGGRNGITYTSLSSDMNNWTNSTQTFANSYYMQCVYGNGRFVTSNGINTSVSTDGITWSTPFENSLPFSGKILFNGTQFVTYQTSLSASISFSDDGEEWSTPIPISAFSGLSLQSMIFVNDIYYAILTTGRTVLLSTSEDGTNWTNPQETNLSSNILSSSTGSFCYGNGRFVICSNASQFSYSMDGLSWSTPVNSSQFEGIQVYQNSLTFNGEKFVLLCPGSQSRGIKLSTSIDGIHWSVPETVIETGQYAVAAIVFANDNTNTSLSSYNVYNSTDGINYTRVYSLASSLNINPVQAIYMGVSTSYDNTDLSNVVISDPYSGKLYLKDWEIDTDYSIWNMRKEVIVSDNKFLQYYHLPNYNRSQYTIEDIGNPEYTITFLDTSFTGNNDLIDFSNPHNFTMCIKVDLKGISSKILLAKTNLLVPSEATLTNESNPYFLLSYIKQNLALTIYTNEKAYVISKYLDSNELAAYQGDSILLTFSFENINDIYTIKMYRNNEIISELRTGLNQMQEASDSFLTNYVQDEIVENICAQYEEDPEELAKLVEEIKSNTDKYVQDIIVLEGAITSDNLYYITNLTDTNY